MFWDIKFRCMSSLRVRSPVLPVTTDTPLGVWETWDSTENKSYDLTLLSNLASCIRYICKTKLLYNELSPKKLPSVELFAHNKLLTKSRGHQFQPIRVLLTKWTQQASSNQQRSFMRFQVLTAASMIRAVFWVILPCKMIVDRRFRGAYCLHHHHHPWWWRQYAPLKRR
jgi:hypothetical protein